jgi:hypothetical protein
LCELRVRFATKGSVEGPQSEEAIMPTEVFFEVDVCKPYLDLLRIKGYPVVRMIDDNHSTD